MNRFIVALPQAAAIAMRQAKILVVGLSFGALLAVSNFVGVPTAPIPTVPMQ